MVNLIYLFWAKRSIYEKIGRKTVAGSYFGGMKEIQEMVDFAAKHNITADIEVISMDYVNTAMGRLAKSDVRYRFVIDIGNTLAPTKSSRPASSD